jgi:hypothetical protein
MMTTENQSRRRLAQQWLAAWKLLPPDLRAAIAWVIERDPLLLEVFGFGGLDKSSSDSNRAI